MFRRFLRLKRYLPIAAFALAAPNFLTAGAPTLNLHSNGAVVAVGSIEVAQTVYDPDASDGSQFPQRIDGANVSWNSSNPSVATIVNGVIFGLAAGNATLTATYSGLSAQIQVKVAGTLAQHSLVTPDGRTRTYLLYLPAGYRAGTPIPLVLNFHGAFDSGLGQMFRAQMNPIADRNTFAVAYPDGVPDPVYSLRTFNAGGCCSAVDDVVFTRRMISDIRTKITVDSRKIYSTGLSNGGMMSHRLACEMPDLIAAIAPVAGTLVLGADFPVCNPGRPVPVLEFHGTTDLIHPYSLVPATVRFWLDNNGISSSLRQVTVSSGIVSCETYPKSAQNIVGLCTANPTTRLSQGVTVYDGGGHMWPGGTWTTPDYPTQDASASEIMWNFFAPLTLQSPATEAPSILVYPNPLRPAAGQRTMNIVNAKPGGDIKIHTIAGDRIRSLRADANGIASWDGRNESGEEAASGVYVGVAEAAGGSENFKLVIQR